MFKPRQPNSAARPSAAPSVAAGAALGLAAGAKLGVMPGVALRAGATRFAKLDVLRALAMLWMTVFHFCFDLNTYRFIAADFYNDGFWTGQRTAIVSLFLFCAGAAQGVALAQGQSWTAFWRRWAQVVGCALVVSLASAVMFPNSFIYFGVLHGIAVMLLVARLSAGWGRGLWLAGALALAAKYAASQAHAAWPAIDFLNDKLFSVLGLMSRRPITEDFVPLVPWLAAVWWGMATAQWVLRNPAARAWVSAPVGAVLEPLARLGRWSLSYYMVHQPVMIGALLAWRWCAG